MEDLIPVTIITGFWAQVKQRFLTVFSLKNTAKR